MPSSAGYTRIASLKDADSFRRHLEQQGVALAFDECLEAAPGSPLARPIDEPDIALRNRFCILPMEGWDGTPEGSPTELTERRWRHFGISGAALIWGGEAVAVRHDGRANPNQLLMSDRTVGALAALRELLLAAHGERFGSTAGLLVGLQLTHSGRYARPNATDRPEPRVAYRHSVLDRRFRPDDLVVLSDEELDAIVEDFVSAAVRAQQAGFQFVDIKHCHGYLGHELLSAVDRPGRYGGSFENRTRFLREIVAGVRRQASGLGLAVRISIFDAVPYKKDAAGIGMPEAPASQYHHAFGLARLAHPAPARDARPDLVGEVSLDEGRAFLQLLSDIGVRLVCITAGSPYYTPHIQRPALFPPSDGYLPPEDPIVGVARQIHVTAAFKREFPNLIFVGSAYSYLQEWLPHVAQRMVRDGAVDIVGLGRMVLAYPELPADVLEGRPLRRKAICRTFSDCTSGPRNGLVSGCFPLDPFYAAHPHAQLLNAAKAAQAANT